MKDMFQDKIKVIVTDYDKFIMDRVHTLMPDITAMTFDFYADDPTEIIKENDIDTVIMIGSGCSMDDGTYIKFLKYIATTDVRNIFTFETGIYGSLKYYLYPPYHVSRIIFRYLFKRDMYENEKNKFETSTCFHAYVRNKNRLKRIYRMAEWDYKRVKCGKWNNVYRLFK